VKPTSVEWFRYESAESRPGGPDPEPYLRVVFGNAGRIQPALGLVDSGSITTCIPPSIAKALGCPLSAETTLFEVFGSIVEARIAVVDLRVPISEGLLEFRGVECAVPLTDEGLETAILGRVPLFREVEVRFQEWLNRFGIQRRRGFQGGIWNPTGVARPGAGLSASRRAPCGRPTRRPPPPRRRLQAR
jgi:hypothetical protein